LKVLGVLEAFEHPADRPLVSSLYDDSNLHMSIFKLALPADAKEFNLSGNF